MLSISKCHGSRLPFGQCHRFCRGARSQQHHRRLSLEQAKVASLEKLQLSVPFPKTMADLLLEVESQMNSSGFQMCPSQPIAHSLLMHSLHLPQCNLLLFYVLNVSSPSLCQQTAFSSVIQTFSHAVQLCIKTFCSRSFAEIIFVVTLLEESHSQL